MKLEIARGTFLLAALVVATVAAAAWEQPQSTVLTSIAGEGNCPLPRLHREQSSVSPDKDFLLFMLGLSHGVKTL